MDTDKPLPKNAFANWVEARNDAPGVCAGPLVEGFRRAGKGAGLSRFLSRC
jgi:hypothetical protein